MLLESVSQFWHARDPMIVTHSATGGLLYVFLRVEIGTSSREVHELQARVRFQDTLDGLATMPGGPVPQEQDANVRYRIQDPCQLLACRFGVHHCYSHRDLLACAQIQGAIEVDLFAPRVHTHIGV